MILNVDPGTEPSGLTLFIESPVFAEPKPQSAQERKKLLKRADAVTLLLEKISTQMLGYALARLETQQFMAAGQPRDDKGRWTKGGQFSTITRGALNKTATAHAKTLSTAQRDAIADYTDLRFGPINASLRTGEPIRNNAEKAWDVDARMRESLMPLDSDIVVHRAFRGAGDLKVGTEFIDHAWVSTSADVRELRNFGDLRNDTTVIRVPKGTQVIPVGKVLAKMGADEGELILAPGMRFKVVDREYPPSGKIKTILEVVP